MLTKRIDEEEALKLGQLTQAGITETTNERKKTSNRMDEGRRFEARPP